MSDSLFSGLYGEWVDKFNIACELHESNAQHMTLENTAIAEC